MQPVISDEVQKQLEEAVKPLLKVINDNGHCFNPHHKFIVTANTLEVLGGEAMVINNDYLKD